MAINPTGQPAQIVQPEHDDANVNANIQVGDADVDAANPVPVTLSGNNEWTIALWAEETANDSDKQIAVTANQVWQLLHIWVEFTTTVVVGDRQITIEIQDGAADVIARIRSGVEQAASLTYRYLFAPSMNDLLANRNEWVSTPMPPTFIFPETYIIRVYDITATDAAADDMIVQMGYAWRPE